MKVYSYSQARQQLASLLNQAQRDGQVRIRRRDGGVFVVQPVSSRKRSPLDVGGVSVRAAMSDILTAIRASRRSTERLLRPVRRASGRSPVARRGARHRPSG